DQRRRVGHDPGGGPQALRHAGRGGGDQAPVGRPRARRHGGDLAGAGGPDERAVAVARLRRAPLRSAGLGDPALRRRHPRDRRGAVHRTDDRTDDARLEPDRGSARGSVQRRRAGAGSLGAHPGGRGGPCIEGACGMIRINLLPEEYRKKAGTPIKMLVAIAGLVAVNAGLLSWWGWTVFGIHAKVDSERATLQLEMDGLAPQVTYYHALETESKQYKSREKTLASITAD